MISSRLSGAKKFKVRLNSSMNCSVCVRITFDEMESSFPSLTGFVFNFGIGSLEQSVKLGRFVIFDFLNTTFSKPTTKNQCFLQYFRCLRCFSAAVAKENLPKTPAIVSLANFVATFKARIWLAVCEFLWLLTNQNVWFVTFFALN